MKRLMRLKPKVKLHTDFYVWDVETTQLRAKADVFILGVIYGHNFCKTIHSVEEFKTEFLDPRYKNKKVFAHNAEYDLSVIYDNIYELDPEAIFNGKFISASNGNAVFCDSLNIYRFKLEKLGELLGHQKQFTKRDYETGLGNKDLVEVENGCIRDCEILWDALYEFFEEAGDIKITQASLSLTYYRRHFQPYNIEFNDKLVKYFFNSYYGGRTEAFKIGPTNATVIDKNSMYPWGMKHCVFPNPRDLKIRRNVPIKRFLRYFLVNFEGCVLCSVDHRPTYFGYLPLKMDGKLCFPIGKFRGWFNFNELRFAVDSGVVRVEDVEEMVYAPRMQTPFAEFVDDLYKKRFEENSPLKKIVKKIELNSLYGKLAQRIDTESIYISDVSQSMELIREYQKKGRLIQIMPFNSDRMDCFLMLKKAQSYDLSYQIPSFSSYITSYCRVDLLRNLLKYSGNKPVYCDTDSIFMETPPDDLPNSNVLGDWKIEDKKVTHIKGLKNYTYWEDGIEFNAIKGVPRSAEQIAPNTYQFTNLVKTKEALRRNIENGVQITRTKILKNKYTKREVLPGGETKPLNLEL